MAMIVCDVIDCGHEMAMIDCDVSHEMGVNDGSANTDVRSELEARCSPSQTVVSSGGTSK
jgi:hypothetical protein